MNKSSASQDFPVAGLRVCALLTTFNRRELTLACLQALERSARVAGVTLSAVVVDDASRDGTAEAVGRAFPWARVIAGDGNLFWCRGMHRAFDAALRIGFDHYLWLNDDTSLTDGALAVLLDCANRLAPSRGKPVIVVGSTADPCTGEHTYGGEARPSRLRPLHVAPVLPRDEPQPCDSMTGNIVLVSAAVAARVGNLDPAFEHAMGDTDYALRARRAGVELWLAPGVLGDCCVNPSAGSFRDPTLPLAQRWRLMLDRKGLPWRSWLHLARRHAGPLWPLHFAWPYVKLVATSATSRRAAKAAGR